MSVVARLGLVLVMAFCAPSCGGERGAPEPSAPAERLPPSEAAVLDPPLGPEPAVSELGGAPEATHGARGPWTEELVLDSAAYDVPRAPSAVVHAPPSFDPTRPLRLVVFLHGWNGCARVLVLSGPTPCRDGERPRDGWDLAGRIDAAGTDALFIVPQLAFLERNGHPGRFLEPHRFRAFLDELLARLAPRLGDGANLARVESITLLAHSAGFETALAILARGGVDVRNVVLFDALYRGVEPFIEWAEGEPHRRLVSLYTGDGRTAHQNRLLAARARRSFGDAVAADAARTLADLVREMRVVVARSSAPHGAVPAHHIPELLGPLGLSARSEVHSAP